LSGEFFAKLFEAALKNQTLEEVKAVNQVSPHLFSIIPYHNFRVFHFQQLPSAPLLKQYSKIAACSK
jgi:hypothetical protein